MLRLIFGEGGPRGAPAGPRIDPGNEYLQCLLLFSSTNPDTKDVIERVEAMAREFDPASVTGLRQVFECGGGDRGAGASSASITYEQIKCEAAPLSLLEHVAMLLLEGARQMRAATGQTTRNSKEEYLKSLSAQDGGAPPPAAAAGANADFQRKIGPVAVSDHALFDPERPWVPADARDLVGAAAGAAAGNACGSSSLIVVASLLDKPANLGGISRTAEVFGATTLVLPSLAVMRQDEFKAVAASSERHLDVEEVPPAGLQAWLQRKRAAGFSLIGLEQTMESRSLLDFRFPSRTCLVLGHEVYGVAPEVLQLLDASVEIPQVGHVRSLNVHVSSALAVFVHAKQTRLAGSARGL